MNYRPFARSGFDVSEIGFGTWGLGGNFNGAVAYGATRDDESRAALREAFVQGVTFYDTSDFYGFGHSETLLGEEFSLMRDKIVLSTKAGFVDATRQDFTSVYISNALEGSLRRLKTDYVDVFFLHSPDLGVLRELPGTLDLVRDWRRAGRVRCWGISTQSPQDAISAITDFGVECIQVNFNLADMRAIKIGLWELCEREKIGVVVRTPLAFGFLTGTIAGGQAFAPEDHRRRFSPQQQEKWRSGVEIYRHIFEKENDQATLSQNALRFCLGFKAVSTVIPGMLTVGQVKENVGAGRWPPLSPESMEACIQEGLKNDFF